MKTDFSCGIVPVIFDGTKRRYLLVQHAAGHWAFPKGHPEGSELRLETARRELAEETGLVPAAVLETPIFEEDYAFTKRSGKTVRKNVVYFVGRVNAAAGVVLQAEEVRDHAWGDAAATAQRMSFGEGRRMLAEVEAFLSGGGGSAIGL